MSRVPVASRKSRHRFRVWRSYRDSLSVSRRYRFPATTDRLGVQVHVERDAAGQRVEVEPADVGVELLFRHHPFGVAGEQVLAGRGEVVGDDQGGLVAADAGDRGVTDLAADVCELNHVFVQAGASAGERANAQLKAWRILRKLRCCHRRAGQLAKAIYTLIIHEAKAG